MRKLGTLTTFKPDEVQKSETDNIGYNSTGIGFIVITILRSKIRPKSVCKTRLGLDFRKKLILS